VAAGAANHGGRWNRKSSAGSIQVLAGGSTGRRVGRGGGGCRRLASTSVEPYTAEDPAEAGPLLLVRAQTHTRAACPC
jgi:hypothetical protein